MTDGYAERRREYVAEIRNSFESGETDGGGYERVQREDTAFSFSRLSFFLSVGIFIAFLYLHFTGAEVYGYHAEDIVDIVSDNHYYTNLQDYVMIEKQDSLSEE